MCLDRLDAWRRHLVDAQQKEDILGVKNFLTRFVSKIDVGYKTAHMHYTYPIDDLKHLNNSGPLRGTCLKETKIAGMIGDFDFPPGDANHDKNQGQ